MPPCRLARQEAEFWLPWRKATGSPGNSPPPCRLARQEAEFWLPWREATGSLHAPTSLPREVAGRSKKLEPAREAATLAKP